MEATAVTGSAANATWAPQALKGYVRFTAWFFAVIGLALLYTALDDEPLLREPDAVTGLSCRLLLLLGAILHFGVGYFLFSGRSIGMQGLLILWVALDLAVYRVGMIWMKSPPPFPVIVLTGWKLGIQPATLDLYWKIMLAYLAMGGVIIVVFDWVRLRRMKNEAWKRWWAAYQKK